MFTHSQYLSPFTWRYASQEMRKIFSEEYKLELWRKIWVELAEVQAEAGLVSKKELADLKKHQHQIDISVVQKIEEKTHHDVVAAIQEFALRAKSGGGKIHLGATSMDVVDNTDMLRMIEACQLIRQQLKLLILTFVELVEKYSDTVCMAYTHLQPAEPTTLGYRFAGYLQDLMIDYDMLDFTLNVIEAKGMKGAVGTRASYQEVLKGSAITAQQLDERVSAKLGVRSVLIATQVYPRKFDFFVLNSLASIASSLSKCASDVRILSTPAIGELSESFGKTQVGSSAMPFKKNPINAEKVCSLARYIASLPQVAWSNAALSHLERTLDDSANKRIIISEGFLALDESLKTMQKIMSGIVIHKKKISQNVDQYGPFAGIERVIIQAVKKGANRQELHELTRKISMDAWEQVQDGRKNPLDKLLISNKKLQIYLNQKEIEKALDVSAHIGDVEQRIKTLIHRAKILFK